jgi:hypothetical protein
MATVKLERVSLVNPMGDMGDRTIQGISTFIVGDEWQLEADFHRGTIGDVSVYRNTAYPKGSEPTWQWYAGIPTANIKTYRLSEPPKYDHGESKAEAQANPVGGNSSGKAAHGARAGGGDVELDVPGARSGQVRA